MVYIVGAGSGDPDLITVKGLKLLKAADVVIWAGSLVNPELLKYIKKGCAVYDSAFMTLEEVIFLIEKSHQEGKDVVRLHTGDPSIYGAIKEQMDILAKKQIPFTVVPGVSSFCAAAAALDAEYTLPGVTQSIIITRMEGRTPVPEAEKLSKLASHGCTMAIFLSIGMIDILVQELLAAGAYNKDTPVAVVYKASWADQKIIRATLDTIAEQVHKAEIGRTALILVGNFLEAIYERSCLYDPSFSTGYRPSKIIQDGE